MKKLIIILLFLILSPAISFAEEKEAEFNLDSVMGEGANQAAVVSRKLVVYPMIPYSTGLSKQITETVNDYIVNEFSATGDFEVKLGAAERSTSPAKRYQKVQEPLPFPLEKLWVKFDSQIKRGNFRSLSKTIRKTIKKYSNKAVSKEQYYQLQKLYLYYGYVLWKRSSIKPARKVLIVSMLIDLNVDNGRFFNDPYFGGFYNRVRRDLLNQKRSSIEVSSIPEGAKVFYYGRELGKTPLVLDNATKGIHQIRLELDGVGQHVKRLNLKRKQAKVMKSWLWPGSQRGKTLNKGSKDPVSVTKRGVNSIAGACKKAKFDFALLLPGISVANLIKVQPLLIDCKKKVLKVAREVRFDKQLEGAQLEFSTLAVEVSSMIEDASANVKKYPVKMFQAGELGSVDAKKIAVAPGPISEGGMAPVIMASPVANPSTDDGALDLSLTSSEENQEVVLNFENEGLVDDFGVIRSPFYKKMWFWLVVGGAVVGTTTALVLLNQPSETDAVVDISWQ